MQRGGWVEHLLYNLGVGGSDSLLYNVIWVGGGQRMAIFALYNLCTTPYMLNITHI